MRTRCATGLRYSPKDEVRLANFVECSRTEGWRSQSPTARRSPCTGRRPPGGRGVRSPRRSRWPLRPRGPSRGPRGAGGERGPGRRRCAAARGVHAHGDAQERQVAGEEDGRGRDDPPGGEAGRGDADGGEEQGGAGRAVRRRRRAMTAARVVAAARARLPGSPRGSVVVLGAGTRIGASVAEQPAGPVASVSRRSHMGTRTTPRPRRSRDKGVRCSSAPPPRARSQAAPTFGARTCNGSRVTPRTLRGTVRG